MADLELLAGGEVLLEGVDLVEVVEVVGAVLVEEGAGGVEGKEVVTDEIGGEALGLWEGEVAQDESEEEEGQGEGGTPEAAEGGGGWSGRS